MTQHACTIHAAGTTGHTGYFQLKEPCTGSDTNMPKSNRADARMPASNTRD